MTMPRLWVVARLARLWYAQLAFEHAVRPRWRCGEPYVNPPKIEDEEGR